MHYAYIISHVPGKQVHTADALSRVVLMRSLEPGELKVQKEVDWFLNGLLERKNFL